MAKNSYHSFGSIFRAELEKFIVSSLLIISYHSECISLPPDVLGSAVGWAGVVRGTGLGAALETWRQNPAHFSLGVCNGCQLMALLGWLDPPHHHGQYFSSLLQFFYVIIEKAQFRHGKGRTVDFLEPYHYEII